MLTSPYFVGIYWKARRESMDQCAARLSQVFSELDVCDEALATWYEQDRSRKKALQKQVDIHDRERLLGLLDRGRHWNDNKELLEEAGFLVCLWNGRDREKQATMYINCGGYSKWLDNNVVLDLPEQLGDLGTSEGMAAVLSLLVRAWEPDCGGVMSQAAMKAMDYKMEMPFVDWMLYLSTTVRPEIPPMPSRARVHKVGDLGSIVVVQDEPPDFTNPDHLRNIELVEAALGMESLRSIGQEGEPRTSSDTTGL